MKVFYTLIIYLALLGCNKVQTVLICGDHVCINKAEANQYFEDNLSLEVKFIDKNEKKQSNLVELNLESNSEGKKSISVLNKIDTDKNLKELSKKEVIKKKAQLKKRKKLKNLQTKKQFKNKKKGKKKCL